MVDVYNCGRDWLRCWTSELPLSISQKFGGSMGYDFVSQRSASFDKLI